MSTKWSLGDLAPKPDAARARELMQSAGAGSKALLLLSSGFTGRWPYKALAEMIQAALKDTGLEVEIRSVDGAAWGKAMKAGEYDFSLTPHTLMTGDPDFFFYSWLHSRGEMAKSRAHGYTSAEADSLIEQGAREQSESKRKQIYDDLQRLAARDLSIIPVYHETGILAARSYVKNLYMDVQFQVALTKISQEGKA